MAHMGSGLRFLEVFLKYPILNVIIYGLWNRNTNDCP